MTKTTPWVSMARPYGTGYQAPSTALYTTDRATLSIGKSSGSVTLKAPRLLPDYFEFLLTMVPVPLEGQPVIHTDTYSREVFGEVLASYQYSGVKLMATDTIRYNGQFDRVANHPEIIFPLDGVIYELRFDGITQDIYLDIEKESPVWAVGGVYQEGCALRKIRQSFARFYVQNEAIHHRLTHLEDWWERGMRPPHGVVEGERLENATQRDPYLSMENALRQGEAKVCICMGVDEVGDKIYETYYSIDASPHGSKQIMVTFERK
jgi:hypothetical protein